MNFLSGDLIKYQKHRLYVLNVVKHWFKEYIVCIDFTKTIETNNDHITITILYQTSSKMYKSVEDDDLFDTIHQKSVTQLQKNAKETINMLGDVGGVRSAFTEKERMIICKYIEAIMCN